MMSGLLTLRRVIPFVLIKLQVSNMFGYTVRTQLCNQVHVLATLLGHHQVVLSLQSNCSKSPVYLIGDEKLFTMVRYINSITRVVPIFAIYILCTIF